MTKFSKPVLKATKNLLLADNTNEAITPTVHRNNDEHIIDSLAALASDNSYDASTDNYFQWGVRTGVYNIDSDASAITISDTDFRNLIVMNASDASAVTQVNLPANPSVGMDYTIKNRTGNTITLSGNGNQIYTSSANNTRSIQNGGSYRVKWSGTYWENL